MSAGSKNFEILTRRAKIVITGFLKVIPEKGSGQENRKFRGACILSENMEIQNGDKNMGRQGHSDRIASGNEKHISETQRIGSPCYKVTKKLSNCTHGQVFFF